MRGDVCFSPAIERFRAVGVGSGHEGLSIFAEGV